MRKPEDLPVDPEIEAALNSIDATLAGERVDPRHYELAELSLLLRNERPLSPVAFATRLDERVQRRFATAPRATRSPRRRRPWVWAPAGALVASLAVAVVIVVSEGGRSSSSNLIMGTPVGAGPAKKSPAPPRLGSSTDATRGAFGPAIHASRSSTQALSTAQSAQRGTYPAPLWLPAGPQAAGVLQPPSSGRKITRSGQLELSTRSRLIDQVAQEVFDVVGQQQGFVQSSNVTAGGSAGGYAQFQLSIPTARLTQTMTSLSTLPHARVVSRTDTTQDVTNSYQGDQRRLADARALRVSLLKQLAAATTQGEIDSLTARLHSTEAAISSDENALHSLQHQIVFSQVSVAINGGVRPVPVAHSSGLTLGRAAHDAGRVLTVAAGVALIALAAILPVGLLAALGWWIWTRIRQRRRLAALDVI